jgi:hypothetical protein
MIELIVTIIGIVVIAVTIGFMFFPVALRTLMMSGHMNKKAMEKMADKALKNVNMDFSKMMDGLSKIAEQHEKSKDVSSDNEGYT